MTKNDVKIISNAAILQPEGGFSLGSIRIENGIISAISAGTTRVDPTDENTTMINANGMAAMPGLVNGHTHFSQAFMRGLAGGRPLLQWLRELIWPLQSEISVEEMNLAALLSLAENLRGGVTSLVDHHKITRTKEHTLAVQKAVATMGMRCAIARAWVNKGKNPEEDQAILSELEEWFSQSQADSLVSYASGPLTPWRVTEKLLQQTHQLAKDYGSFTHIHVSETQDEVQMSLDEYGVRPVKWLHQIGVLDDHTQVVHAVWVDDEEIETLARQKATVVHCPVSNAVLGSGIAPVQKFLKQGITLRLGSDGSASNDTQDCFETMKMAVCLARASQKDASAISCIDALKMATANRVLSVGEPADLILVDMDSLSSAPVQDIESALVLSTRRDDVDTVLVNGEILMRDKELVCIDEDVIIKECNLAIKSLRKRAGIEK